MNTIIDVSYVTYMLEEFINVDKNDLKGREENLVGKYLTGRINAYQQALDMLNRQIEEQNKEE